MRSLQNVAPQDFIVPSKGTHPLFCDISDDDDNIKEVEDGADPTDQNRAFKKSIYAFFFFFFSKHTQMIKWEMV